MPIFRTDYGMHKDVPILKFGTGDILMLKTDSNRLLFAQHQPKKIGETTKEFSGKTSDDVPGIKCVFEFDKVESITALVSTLLEIQENMFNDTK